MALDGRLPSIRLELDEQLEFEKLCNTLNKTPTTFVREMVIAANSNRLTIEREASLINATKGIYNDN